MLDLKADREAALPKDAATIILVREARGPGERGVEIFCVERSKQSRFLGGAIVFPGGKLDQADGDGVWESLSTPAMRPMTTQAEPFTRDDAHLRALAVAACRETLEEAAMLPLSGDAARSIADDELLGLRARLATEPGALRTFLEARSLRLDLGALHPFARWITPEAEARRYDTRFFVAVAPEGQRGAHDEHETMASFWATPAEILRRWEAGEVQVAPPTHRTLASLASCMTTPAVLEAADRACLDPICPRLVQQGDTIALSLPGDPEHDVREARVSGHSRYVLRGDRWIPEDAPPRA